MVHRKLLGGFLFLVIYTMQWQTFQSLLAVNPDTQYTPAEKEALTKFKGAVADIIYKDYQKLDSYLIHYLRHKNLNVAEAVQLLKENFKWRKEQKIDTIVHEKRMVDLEPQLPYKLEGVDKGGRPIAAYIMGKWDIRKLVLSGKTEEYYRYQIYLTEKAQQKVNELAVAGKDVSQFIILADLSGFNLRQHGCLPCLQGSSAFAQLMLDRYPNSIHQQILVNAPSSFARITNLAKRIIPHELLERVFVFGFDKSEWEPYLSKIIDKDQLSIIFGGTLT